jgi:putative exosortase-associated protein (TIGR04073 family)
MRKIPFLLAAFILIASALSFPCRAEDCKCKKSNLFTKLGWGIVNVLYAPAELVKGFTCEPYNKGMAYDLPVGIGKGFCNMTKRFGAGAYEVSTSPVPAPKSGPVLKEDGKKCCIDNYEGGEK